MRSAVLVLTLLAALLVPASAHAIYPAAGVELQAHDHETAGRNWHVQFMISKKDPKVIQSLVLYSEVCKTTVLKSKVKIRETGEISAFGNLKGGGTWQVGGQVTAPDTIVGAARVVKGSCNSGALNYTAQTASAHQHAHGRTWPDFANASIDAVRQAQQLRRNAWKATEKYFPTFKAALDEGYKVSPTFRPRPGLFHIRNYDYIRDDVIFNSTKPESLVYWWRPDGDHVLLGFMFYVPAGKRVKWGGPIPIYHQHFGKGASNPMTHVWLTNDPVTAWANCLPIRELEYAHLGFTHNGAGSAFGDAGQACPS